jgi:Skp family chaperone for outer membrane proteins
VPGRARPKGNVFVMRLLKTTIAAAILTVVTAGAATAQTTPPAQPPKPATPAPAPTTPAPAPAAPAAPAPYPEGAKIAYVDVQAIASTSSEGKTATTRLQELDKKNIGGINEKNKALEAARTKRTTTLAEAAQVAVDREIEKLTRELQYLQQEAQVEREQLQQELQLEFQKRLFPVLDAIGKEKGLHVIVDAVSSGAFWADRGLDLTAEVIKRLDTGKPAAAPPKK